MTLNTFHSAGISAKNVTLGVPRLKEIINVATTIKTPSLTVHIKKELAKKEDIMRQIQTKIESLKLSQVLEKSEIFYDPDPNNTIVVEDQPMLDLYSIAPEDPYMSDVKQQSPWLLRMVLDQEKLIGQRIRIDDIAMKVRNVFQRTVRVMNSDVNDETQVIRFRLKKEDDPDADEMALLKQFESEITHNLSLQGFPEIKKVYTKMVSEIYYDEETGGHEESKKDRWTIETDGCALAKVLAVEHVDHKRTTSNNIIEIFNVLGIEAGR
jgi:DNA-directed RNA polymerase II subunit RPB1